MSTTSQHSPAPWKLGKAPALLDACEKLVVWLHAARMAIIAQAKGQP